MAELKITVQVEQDGVVLPGYPLVQRVVVEQVTPWTPIRHGPNPPATFVSLQTGNLGVLQALIVRPDRLVTVRYDGQTDAGLEIEAGGLLVVLGGRADALGGLQATANAPQETQIHGLAAGAAP